MIFTTAPQQLINKVATKQPQLLGFHFESEVPRLKTVSRPIQAWYVTASRSGADIAVDDIWSGAPIGPRLGSRLNTQVRSSIVFVLIVVDTNKVAGATIGTIADYVALVALTVVQSPNHCDPLPSILDLMSSSCGAREKPTAITAGDLAFLKALYYKNTGLGASLSRFQMQDNMMEQFKPH